MILIALIFVLIPLAFYLYSNPTPITYQAQVSPAFSQGGFQKGSGGQITQPYANNAGTFSSAARTRSGALLPTEAYPSAQTCGQCHISIKDHWQESMHSISGTDPWYLKVKELFVFEQGANAVQFCAGCHAPVSLMTGEIGLYNREAFGATSGVNCVFCHTMHEVKGGNAQYVSDPERIRSYFGQTYLKEDGVSLSAHLVMANPKVHKEDMMRPFYRTSEFCQSCHELEINGIKTQSTYSEWKNSRYAREGTTCQSCHFTPGATSNPETGRKAEHYPVSHNRVLRHQLGGGSTLNAPNPQQNVSVLKESVQLTVSLKRNQLKVSVKNTGAGHSIPTGVGDLRELWLEVKAFDASNALTFSSGVPDAAGRLPDDSVIFHQVFADAQGNVLTRHDQWRVAKILKDTRISADGTRSSGFVIPQGSKRVEVRLLWRDAPDAFFTQVLEEVLGEKHMFELARWEKTN